MGIYKFDNDISVDICLISFATLICPNFSEFSNNQFL